MRGAEASVYGVKVCAARAQVACCAQCEQCEHRRHDAIRLQTEQSPRSFRSTSRTVSVSNVRRRHAAMPVRGTEAIADNGCR